MRDPVCGGASLLRSVHRFSISAIQGRCQEELVERARSERISTRHARAERRRVELCARVLQAQPLRHRRVDLLPDRFEERRHRFRVRPAVFHSSDGNLTISCGRLLSAETQVTLIKGNISITGCPSNGYDQGGVTAVPEPASMVLLGSGLIVAYRRRRSSE